MDIRIDKNSPVPIRQQLVKQIVFLIATGRLKPGDPVQSVRQAATRQGISRSTVSAAYKELVDQHWLKRHRGKRLVVRSPHEGIVPREPDIDDLINAAIQMARNRGYSLRQLTERVRHRLLIEPPDHILVVTREPEIGELLCSELSAMLPRPVERCLLEELSRRGGPGVGALVTCLPGVVWDVAPLLPTGRYVFPLKLSDNDEHVRVIRQLSQPSVIALVSISPYLLETARALLAPLAGNHHSIEAYCLKKNEKKELRAADLVFCDAVVLPRVVAPKIVPYRLVSDGVAREIESVIDEQASLSAGP